MLEHHFYQKYANTPLAERSIPLNFNKYGLLNLNSIYEELKRLDEIVRPYDIEIEHLLSKAEWFYHEREERLKGATQRAFGGEEKEGEK